MKASAIIATIIIASFLSHWSRACSAEQIDRITAENVSYEYKTSVMTAKGNAHYKTVQYEIWADLLKYNTDTEEMTSHGNVRLAISNFQDGKQATIAAKTATYDKKNKLFYARGDAHIVFDHKELSAQRICYDETKKTLEATGDVVWKDAEGKILHGTNFIYHIDNKEGSVYPFTYRFREENISYYSQGNKISYNDNKGILEQGLVTSCNFENAHYTFSAEKADYYPGKKLVLHKPAYWEHGKKLFQYPKLVIPLRRNPNGEEETLFPSFGFSEEEGWYAKTKWYYDLKDQDYGIIHLDYMTKKGWGIGFREFHFSPIKEEFYFYRSKKMSLYNQEVKAEYKRTNDSELQLLSFRHEDRRWLDQSKYLAMNWNYSGTKDTRQVNASLGYNHQTGEYSNNQLQGIISVDDKLSDRLRSSINLDFSRWSYSGGEANHDRNIALSLDYSAPNYFVQLYQLERKQGYDYAPRLTVQSNLNTPIQFEFVTNRIVRNYSQFSVQQNEWKTNYFSAPIRLIKQSFLTYNFSTNHSFFNNGDTTTSWSGSANVLTNFSAKVYSNTRLTAGQNKGYDPVLQYDIGSKRKTGEWDVNWRLNDKHNFIVGSGYDFERQLYLPLTGTLSGQEYPFWNWTMATNYDLNQRSWNLVSLYLTFNPDSKFAGYVSASYHPKNRILQDLSGKLQFKLGTAWDVSIQSIYNTYDKTLDVSELKVIRSFHCRELQFTYYPLEKVFYFNYMLTNSR